MNKPTLKQLKQLVDYEARILTTGKDPDYPREYDAKTYLRDTIGIQPLFWGDGTLGTFEIYLQQGDGGANISIDTRQKKVVGFWGNYYHEANYIDTMDIESELLQQYKNGKI
jgi:hypothetical protein